MFAYLLFKELRELGAEVYLGDCDVFSPTFRKYHFNSDAEEQFVLCAPGYNKLEDEVDNVMYDSFVEILLAYTRSSTRVILLDGIGKYSDKTRVLLDKFSQLIVVCRSEITDEELNKLGYTLDGKPIHPFNLLSKPRQINVTSKNSKTDSDFDEKRGEARVWGLDRQAIVSGDVSDIPKEVLTTVRSIAKFILERWT